MDYIGNIAVPEIPISGVFPIMPDMGWGQAWEPEIAIHQFGAGDAKVAQRFLSGTGARRFSVRRIGSSSNLFASEDSDPAAVALPCISSLRC